MYNAFNIISWTSSKKFNESYEPGREIPVTCPCTFKSVVSVKALLSALALCLPLILMLAQTPTLRLQPQLQAMAAEQPTQRVHVIVQKTPSAGQLEQQVSQLGGVMTQDLPIINAFAAELSADAAIKLAKADGVKWVSLDAPMVQSGGPDGTVDTSKLLNVYNKAIRADAVWTQGYQGSSVAVAIVDSGISILHQDFITDGASRIKAHAVFNNIYKGVDHAGSWSPDYYGHGTHVAGIIGGDGSLASGKYIGVAPKVNLINVKISDDTGMATMSQVVSGLQWVYDNRTTHNIRVVNLSLNSTAIESYQTSPLSAAVEILWLNKIVVVVPSGNNGNAKLYPPANDPLVITVGATDDKGTLSLSDDVVASFSAYGKTADGFSKPDLVAPGRYIVSPLPFSSVWKSKYPERVVENQYFRLSGTSMAAPMVAGAAALLLQANPNLTPDQVKYRLMATANKSWKGYSTTKAGAGYLDVYAAINGTTTSNSNTGVAVSNLLTTGMAGVLSPSVSWNSVSWNSVSWNSVSWNSVSWNSVSWNSVSWNSDYWE